MKPYFTFILISFLSSIQVCLGQDKEFTGYATAVINEKGIVNIKTSGFANRKENIKYSKNTIQPVASVSKTFIGISLMIAKEKGLIDLDRDINEYLDFKVENPYVDNSNTITLRHLATHTSGIIDNKKIYESTYSFEIYPKTTLKTFLFENLENNIKNVKKSFSRNKAGVKYEYSNIGSALAAYIVERVSKKPFNEFTNEYIFKPINMKHTSWFYRGLNSKEYSILYDERDQPIKPYSCVTYPDGSLKTNIQDLSLYLFELMKGYKGKGVLLSEKSWNELYTMHFNETNSVESINPKEPNSGVFIAYFKSGKIGHTGSDLGVCTFMMFNPKTGIGQVLMANEDLSSNNIDAFKKIWSELGL